MLSKIYHPKRWGLALMMVALLLAPLAQYTPHAAAQAAAVPGSGVVCTTSTSPNPTFTLNATTSNGRRIVHDWLPLHLWTSAQVWARIRASGVRHHQAYDLGMPRLSCCFCIFSPRSALLLAGKHNPALLAEYVKVEKEIGHKFRLELPLASIQQALEDGEEPGPVQDWFM